MESGVKCQIGGELAVRNSIGNLPKIKTILGIPGLRTATTKTFYGVRIEKRISDHCHSSRIVSSLTNSASTSVLASTYSFLRMSHSVLKVSSRGTLNAYFRSGPT